ncbi:Siderophore iron transporter 1 [Fusarium oxysporum f. sp. albedinis]|nr:Siderophore iron transporter 1 [Fusarium oxysporum f. sp. albedinis]
MALFIQTSCTGCILDQQVSRSDLTYMKSGTCASILLHNYLYRYLTNFESPVDSALAANTCRASWYKAKSFENGSIQQSLALRREWTYLPLRVQRQSGEEYYLQ